jgi:hypothetical protein
MGEGKTQVINSMIVLYNLFEARKGQPSSLESTS